MSNELEVLKSDIRQAKRTILTLRKLQAGLPRRQFKLEKDAPILNQASGKLTLNSVFIFFF